jgi:hypothetical protein
MDAKIGQQAEQVWEAMEKLAQQLADANRVEEAWAARGMADWLAEAYAGKRAPGPRPSFSASYVAGYSAGRAITGA